jgi:hypothetical protein
MSRTPGKPFDAELFRDFRRAVGTEPTMPNLIGADLNLKQALALAVQHIEHMAAWITKQNAGYSFESLGEDMPSIREALGSVSSQNRNLTHES